MPAHDQRAGKRGEGGGEGGCGYWLRRSNSVASLIGRLGSSAFRPSAAAVGRYHSRARASLRIGSRPFHHGIRGRGGTIFRAALPAGEAGSSDTELTSSIVPRGTSFHRWVELGFPPIAIDPLRLSCRCERPGPPELRAVNPDAVQTHGQSARQATIAPTLKRARGIAGAVRKLLGKAA